MRRALTALAIVTMLAGCTGAEPTASGAPAPERVTETVTATETVTERVTEQVTVAPPAPPPPPQPAAPTTIEEAGTLVVGQQVTPGLYRNDGDPICVWRRLSGLESDLEANYIDGGFARGQTFVEIHPSDVAFFHNCETNWVRQ